MTRRRRRVLTLGAVFVVVVLALLTAEIVGLSVKIVSPQSDLEPAAGLADRPLGAFAGYVWPDLSPRCRQRSRWRRSYMAPRSAWRDARPQAPAAGTDRQHVGRTGTVSIGSETEAPFDRAEWLQEDPGAEHNHVEYPRLTVPTFRHLTVNAIPPSPGSPDVFSDWMSVNSGTLGTTGPLDDSFTLEREPAVGAFAAQYLRLTEAARAAANSFGSQFSNWTASTPHARIDDATSTARERSRATCRGVRRQAFAAGFVVAFALALAFALPVRVGVAVALAACGSSAV
jgi:hypothetical protein